MKSRKETDLDIFYFIYLPQEKKYFSLNVMFIMAMADIGISNILTFHPRVKKCLTYSGEDMNIFFYIVIKALRGRILENGG